VAFAGSDSFSTHPTAEIRIQSLRRFLQQQV
jgi:Zn-dependent protease with chaperone function